MEWLPGQGWEGEGENTLPFLSWLHLAVVGTATEVRHVACLN